jgi:hypothetical protein
LEEYGLFIQDKITVAKVACREGFVEKKKKEGGTNGRGCDSVENRVLWREKKCIEIKTDGW